MNIMFKSLLFVVSVFVISSCTNVLECDGTPIGVSWWQTSAFFFLWLFFSCPLITQLIMGADYRNDSQEDKNVNKTIAGASIYGFPIMFVMSLALNSLYEWYVNYAMSAVVGIAAGALICSRVDPLNDAYIHKTKYLWIFQVFAIIVSVILAITI